MTSQLLPSDPTVASARPLPVAVDRDPGQPCRLDPDLAGAIEAAVDDIEAARRLPAGLVASLNRAGLFRLYTPAELGGAEVEPRTLCQVVEAVAALDASTAWCVWNANNGFSAPHFDPEGESEIFGPADSVVVNSARVGGQAVTVEGGYRLSGRWDLVSGCDIATWLLLFAVVVDRPEPELLAFALPPGDVTIVDNWHVLGLRGTGSNAVVADGAFVPARRTIPPFGPSRLDRTLFRLPVFTVAACGGAAVCLGAAQGAIDSLRELAATKTSIHGPDPIATLSPVQAALAEADARLRAARAGLWAALDAVAAVAREGGIGGAQERGRVRAAMTLAATTARDVAVSMFGLGSSSAIVSGHPLERRLRDVLVASQHVMLQPLWYEQAGRAMLGLDPTLPVL